MYSIGQFSRLTRLSVKMLRHYDEIGLLQPDATNDDTGYRYYGHQALEKARIICALKELDLPLKVVGEMTSQLHDDADLVSFLRSHRLEIERRIEHLRTVRNTLEALIISAEVSKAAAADRSQQICERVLGPTLFAGVRMRGQYDQIRQAFATVGRRAGLKILGPATGLYYDDEHREDDADFEGGFSVKAPVQHKDVNCRNLEGGKALTLRHVGPYATIHTSYARLLQELTRLGVTPLRPSREVYIKGPGMIFTGNPKAYQTEIQFLLG